MLKKIGRRILGSREKAAKTKGLNAPLSFGFTSRWSIEKQILAGLEDDLPRGNIGAHLCFVLRMALSAPDSYTDVTGTDLRAWGLSFADACQIALSSVKVPRFEALQIGNDKLWAPETESRDALTALFELPHFDVRGDLVLWPATSSCLFAFGTQSLLAIGTRISEIETLSTLPPFPLLVEKGEPTNWHLNDPKRGTSPIELWIADLQRLYLQQIYTEQRDIFNAVNLGDRYVVRYVTHTDHKKHVFSTAVIKEGVNEVWLPEADQVQFKDKAGNIVAEVTWSEFTTLMGEALTEIGTYPARYQYAGFITDRQLSQTMRWRRKSSVRACTCCELRSVKLELRSRRILSV